MPSDRNTKVAIYHNVDEMANRNDTISMMNHLSGERIPFFFAIDFDMGSPIVVPIEELHRGNIRFDFNGTSNALSSGAPARLQYFNKRPLPFERYQEAFTQVQSHLRRGDTYLLNLTFPTAIETNLTLDEIYEASRSRYKLLVRDRFVSFSPETFVTIDRDVIVTCPMKGTVDASLPDGESKILADPKEFAEHVTVVDLLRNDLSMVADDVDVERFRYVEQVRTNAGDLLQVSSRIKGILREELKTKLGTILFTLLPAGSVTGAPKKRTVDIIRNVEGYQRGFYTGIAGYFDGEKLESCVLIRFIEQTTEGLVYKSGGGVTVMSDCLSEYQELIDKVYVPVV